MPEKKKGGRPRKEVDWEKVDNLCKMHCTALEIIEYLTATSDDGLSYDTYDRRAHEDKGASFAEYVNKRHLAFARPKLRELQWKAATGGNVAMLIWLGKQYLQQRDQPEAPQDDAETFDVTLTVRTKVV